MVQQFNSTNAIELIARAHQLVMEGYKHSRRSIAHAFGVVGCAARCCRDVLLSLAERYRVGANLASAVFTDTLVTVWSAPNYCYRCGNVAAILELDERLNKNFKIFEAAPQEARGVPAKKPAPDYFL